MRGGDFAADGETEAGAAVGAGAMGVHSVEPLAKMRQVFGRDTGAGVNYVDRRDIRGQQLPLR